jgi:hypothetical protein
MRTLLWALVLACEVPAAERREGFDADPGWEGHNNRLGVSEVRPVRQDFGYSPTAHAGGAAGEAGGSIWPVGEPAYYARRITTRTFAEPLSASGRLACTGRNFHVQLGFFKSDTINEWRTPNTVVFRLYGRGDVFLAYIGYATRLWRAGELAFEREDRTTGKRVTKPYASGTAVHTWSLRYDPQGNGGGGSVIARLDDDTVTVNLGTWHKADGAAFDRFGLLNVMKHYDQGGEVWVDDVTVNGETETFSTDPKWDGFQNRRTYTTSDIRPWFDFGYSRTHYGGGLAAGELGGRLFRGDGRDPRKMASYGDRLEPLNLRAPLKASGTVCLRRAVSDSTTLLGFFHSEHSFQSGNSDAIATPPDFVGIGIGGPSSEGFYFAPGYRLHGAEAQVASEGPRIFPDGKPRRWSLDYTPETTNRAGRIIVKLGDQTTTLDLPRGHSRRDIHLNRFGLITTHTDGNGQVVYFDDLEYTCRQSD